MNALNARYLVDKSALARMAHPEVRRRLAPIIEAGEAASCAVVDLEVLYSARSYGDYVEIRRRRELAYDAVPLTDATFQRALDVQQALARRVTELRIVGVSCGWRGCRDSNAGHEV